jgi:hypothetical protein
MTGADLVWTRETFFDQTLRVAGAGKISGARTYALGFDVPAGLPPTYHGRATKVVYHLDATVDVPYWFDWKARVEPEVGVAPVGPVHARPVTTRTTGGPKPAIEVRLESSLLRIGGRLRGAAALLDVRPSDTHLVVRAQLEARELTARGYGTPPVIYQRTFDMPVTRPFEGQVVPFEIAIPEDMGCSYRDHAMAIVWWLRVSCVRWGAVSTPAEVQLAIYPAASVIIPSQQAVTLLGAERTYAWWHAAGKRAGLHFDGSTLRKNIAQTDLLIERVIDPAKGPVLVATARYPTLGLGLSIVAETRTWRYSRSDVRLGLPDNWDRFHRVACRDSAQAEAFAGSLGERLASFAELDMDDEQMRVIEKDSFSSPDKIVSLAERLVAFARDLPRARAAIPVPPAMAMYADAWRELAAELDGAFEPASVRVWAKVVGVSAWVWTELDAAGVPRATCITMQPSWPIESDRHFSVAGDDLVAVVTDELGANAADIRRAFRDALWAAADDGGLHLRLVAPFPDPLRLAGRVRLLQQIVARARPGRSAFR